MLSRPQLAARWRKVLPGTSGVGIRTTMGRLSTWIARRRRRGLLALQREAGAAGVELSVHRSVSSAVGGCAIIGNRLSTPPRNVASNGNGDHADKT